MTAAHGLYQPAGIPAVDRPAKWLARQARIIADPAGLPRVKLEMSTVLTASCANVDTAKAIASRLIGDRMAGTWFSYRWSRMVEPGNPDVYIIEISGEDF